MAYMVGSSAIAGIVFATGLVLLVQRGQPGIELKKNRKAYRNYFAIFGWRLGWWQPLPKVIGVTLKYYSSLSGNDATPSGSTSWGVWKKQSQRSEKLILMLSVLHSTTGFTVYYYEPEDVNDAIDTAHKMADFFGVPMHQFLPSHLFRPLESI